MTSHVGVGIALAVFSAALYNTGIVLEKLATTRMPAVHARRSLAMLRVLFRSPLWDLGCVLVVLGLATQVVALTLIPISLVQGVIASGIVLLIILSHRVLGDRLGRYEYLGIATIGAGLILFGLSVNSRADQASSSGSFSALLVGSVPGVAAGLLLFFAAERIRGTSLRRARMRTPLFATASGLIYGVASLALKAVSTIVERRGLVHSIPHILSSPALYMLVVAIPLGFLLFQTALPRTVASILVPINNVISSAYFIVVGGVVFHEHLPSEVAPLIFRLMGFAAIVAGLGALAMGGEIGHAHSPPAFEWPDNRRELA
jgi:drug/metabolite transporter (DMT)-like permease